MQYISLGRLLSICNATWNKTLLSFFSICIFISDNPTMLWYLSIELQNKCWASMSPFSCIKVANAVFCLSSSFGRKYLYVGQNNFIVPLPHLISQNLPIMNLSCFSEQLLLINNIFIAVKEKQVAVFCLG